MKSANCARSVSQTVTRTTSARLALASASVSLMRAMAAWVFADVAAHDLPSASIGIWPDRNRKPPARVAREQRQGAGITGDGGHGTSGKQVEGKEDQRRRRAHGQGVDAMRAARRALAGARPARPPVPRPRRRSGCRSRPAPPARRRPARPNQPKSPSRTKEPGQGRAPYRQRGGFLDAVDAGGHVQFLRRHVVRLDRIRVGRRAEQTCVGLEVIAFVDAHHRRPGGEIHVGRAVEGEGGAAAGLQADRRGGAQRGHVIGPGAGRVDDGRARVAPSASVSVQTPAWLAARSSAWRAGWRAPACRAKPWCSRARRCRARPAPPARRTAARRAGRARAAAACGSIRRTLSECRRNSS